MSTTQDDILSSQSHVRPEQAAGDWWYSELLDYTHDAIIVWGLGGQGIVYWNDAAERLYGYTREQALGKVTHSLLQTQLSFETWELEAAIQRYGVWAGPLRHTTRHGSIVTVEARLILLTREDRWLVAEINRQIGGHTAKMRGT